MPILQQLGIDAGQPTARPVHKVMVPTAKVASPKSRRKPPLVEEALTVQTSLKATRLMWSTAGSPARTDFGRKGPNISDFRGSIHVFYAPAWHGFSPCGVGHRRPSCESIKVPSITLGPVRKNGRSRLRVGRGTQSLRLSERQFTGHLLPMGSVARGSCPYWNLEATGRPNCIDLAGCQDQTTTNALNCYWIFSVTSDLPNGVWTLEVRVDGQPAGSHPFEIAGMETRTKQLTVDQIFKTVGPSIVWIRKLDETGRKADVSTGFIIKPDTIATAFQSIDSAKGLEVEFSDGRKVKTDEVFAVSRLGDWAI